MSATERCKCCGQIMMVRRRNIRPGMLKGLERLFRLGDGAEAKTTELGMNMSSICDFVKMKYWGLIEAGNEESHYRITALGCGFLTGLFPVKKYKWVFNDTVQADPIGAKNPDIFSSDIEPSLCSLATIRENSMTVSEYEMRKQGDLFLK